MNNLKRFYEAAEGNKEIKDALLKANENTRGMKPEEIKKEIIKLGEKFGFEISKEDFEQSEGELAEEEVAKVAGGVSAGCFITNAGCTVLGEIGGDGGCIILGLY